MKRLFNSFLLLLLFCGIVGCSPQVTVTSEVTVTLTPSPTPTSIPTSTSTPEPQLSPETQAELDLAGIDLKDMTNATFNNVDGLTINLENGDVVNVKTEDLSNFLNFGGMHEDKMYGEDHFLPVYDEETGLTTIYEYGKDKKEWFLSEVLSPLEISNDPNKPSSCTARHIFSGAMATELHKLEITFPEDAFNAGWDYKRGEGGSAPLYLSTDSKDAMQIVNICKISNDFLGLTTQSHVLSVGVLNPDYSIGYINFFTENKTWLDKVINKINNTGGTGAGIFREHNEGQIQNAWNHPIAAPFVRLYAIEGEDRIKLEVNKLQINDIVSVSFSRLLVSPNLR